MNYYHTWKKYYLNEILCYLNNLIIFFILFEQFSKREQLCYLKLLERIFKKTFITFERFLKHDQLCYLNEFSRKHLSYLNDFKTLNKLCYLNEFSIKRLSYLNNFKKWTENAGERKLFWTILKVNRKGLWTKSNFERF